MASRARRSVAGSPVEEEGEVEPPADAPMSHEVPRVVVHDAHPRVAEGRPVRLGEPAEEEVVGGPVGLDDHQEPDRVPEQHGHEAALHAAHEQDAPRVRGEQREKVAEGLGAPGVREAGDVLPARVEVEHVVPAEGEVLVGRVGGGPQRQAGGRAREPRAFRAGVERRRGDDERHARGRRAALEPGAGQDARATGGEAEKGGPDAEGRGEAEGQHPRAGEEGDRHAADERAERLDDVETRDALAGLPQPGGRGGQGGERPAHGRARGGERREGEHEREAEARQLARARREGEPQPSPPHDAERRQQGQEGDSDSGVGRSGEGAPAPRGRGPGGDPHQPGRQAHADRGLVAGHVHDELAQQQHLRRGGEEPGREEGRVAHDGSLPPG